VVPELPSLVPWLASTTRSALASPVKISLIPQPAASESGTVTTASAVEKQSVAYPRQNLTILPSRKEGDSYRTQRVPRWVPAANPIRAGLTSQAIRASPALADHLI
jgi:hypothetical protein